MTYSVVGLAALYLLWHRSMPGMRVAARHSSLQPRQYWQFPHEGLGDDFEKVVEGKQEVMMKGS